MTIGYDNKLITNVSNTKISWNSYWKYMVLENQQRANYNPNKCSLLCNLICQAIFVIANIKDSLLLQFLFHYELLINGDTLHEV